MSKRTDVVVTTNPKTGEIFTKSINADGSPKLDKNGKPYGFIRVEQSELSLAFAYNNGGSKTRSSLISMSEKGWNKSKKHYSEGMKIGGTIVIEESLEQKPGSQVKRAGTDENSPVCKVGNQPIYRSTRYSENENEQDVLIAHTNGEEIKAYLAAQKAHQTAQTASTALN